MKTRHIFTAMLLTVTIVVCNSLSAQLDWNTQGNLIQTSQWFGATPLSTIELDIEHQADDLPIIARLILGSTAAIS